MVLAENMTALGELKHAAGHPLRTLYTSIWIWSQRQCCCDCSVCDGGGGGSRTVRNGLTKCVKATHAHSTAHDVVFSSNRRSTPPNPPLCMRPPVNIIDQGTPEHTSVAHVCLCRHMVVNKFRTVITRRCVCVCPRTKQLRPDGHF